MKNGNLFLCCLLIGLCLSLNVRSQTTVTWYNQTFKIDTLYPASGSTGMNSPWEVVYGPDDSLWVTASHDYKIWKIHPGDKGNRVLLDLNGDKDFTSATASPWPQGGLMGLAIHPQFYSGKPWVYIAYVYHLVGCSTGPGGNYCSYNTKIARYKYSLANGNLTYMDDVINGLDGSNDHNSGRVRISPKPESDGKYHLYYTIGDMGAGNLANIVRANHAQDTTIVQGKTLRLNTEPDLAMPVAQQWIPGDNPFPQGAAATAKSPIYSFGHRNPQGLVFGSVNGGSSYILYSSEHGDQSDDEVNIILPHANYGWPKVAGLCDDNYTSSSGDTMTLAGQPVISEKGFCDTTPTALQEPIFSFYNWDRNPNKTAGAMGNMHWPTIAPASIAFYGNSAIPGWNYSLLVPSLKDGLYRLKLKADGLSIDSAAGPTDTLHYLAGYRLRNITVAPSGDTLFVAVDNSCCTIGPNSIIGNSVASPDLGFILRLVYISTLPLDSASHKQPISEETLIRYQVYPNPATETINIQSPPGIREPLFAQLYDITGSLVAEKRNSDGHFSIDVRGLVPGIYILHLNNGYGMPVLTEKILIE
jgi:PQQ-dependent dehydrogenase (s-GDH family)